MYQPVDAFFDFDEGAEIGHIPNPAFDDASHAVAFIDRGPGIGLELLETERNPAVLGMQLKDDGAAARHKVVGILPTGWVHSCEVRRPSYSDHAAVIKVPYSIHSSYSEILELVRAVRPIRVVPIVPLSPCPFSVLAPLLDKDRQLPQIIIPPGLSVGDGSTGGCGVIVRQRKQERHDLDETEGKPSIMVDADAAPVKVSENILQNQNPRPMQRRRVGVTDERRAEIVALVAKNSVRLGIPPPGSIKTEAKSKKNMEEDVDKEVDVKKEQMEDLDDVEDDDDGEAVDVIDVDAGPEPSPDQLWAMFERSQSQVARY